MMYSNKLAIAVKSNGKVLREFGENVYVPFGTEYSLLIKNLNSVRTQVRVTIDGQDTTEGIWLVIPANQEIDLKRFIKNGNMNEGNAFKFIERTDKIEQNRGVGISDGLIRVEYQFERVEAPVYQPRQGLRVDPNTLIGQYYGSGLSGSLADAPRDRTLRSAARGFVSPVLNSVAMNATQDSSAWTTASSNNVALASASSTYVNDTGITVPGSVVDQKFQMSDWFAVESVTHTMVVKLLGETEKGTPVAKPVTVKAKPKCTTCGHVNKATAKFCSGCGTSLEIV